MDTILTLLQMIFKHYDNEDAIAVVEYIKIAFRRLVGADVD